MVERTNSSSRTSRRKFLKGMAGGVAVSAVGLEDRSLMGISRYRPNSWQTGAVEWEAVVSLPPEVTRPWLGAELWANRLQDWRLSESRLECLAGGPNDLGRTVALLTHEVCPGRTSIRDGSFFPDFCLLRDSWRYREKPSGGTEPPFVHDQLADCLSFVQGVFEILYKCSFECRCVSMLGACARTVARVFGKCTVQRNRD